MDPVLLDLPDVPIIGKLIFHSYAAMIALGFLIPTLLAAHHGSTLKKPIYVPTQAAVWALVGGFFGAKLFFLIQYAEPKDYWRAILLYEPGLVFYGGLLGGFTGVFIYLLVTKTFDWRIGDAVAPYIAMGQAFGRMGCFLNGCCWGRQSDLPWALEFPKGSYPYNRHIEDGLITYAAEHSLHIHPTQLYSVAGLLLITAFLAFRLSRNYPFTFSIFLQYTFLYGLLRFCIETFRGDSARSVFGFLTVSQTVSLGMIAVSAIAYVILSTYHSTRAKKANDAESETPEAPAETEQVTDTPEPDSLRS